MRLKVNIFNMGSLAGSITYDAGGKQFALEPPDSNLLRVIMMFPIQIMIKNEMVQVSAKDNPIGFMVGLCNQYRSIHAIQAGGVVDLDETDNETKD